jgi:phosphatidylglycerophosphatase A
MRDLSKKVFQFPAYFIAFGFGSGLAPKAPGTWGTLAAIPLYVLLTHYGWVVYLSVTLMSFILGVFVCEKVSSDLGTHDFGGIVWDEIVGFWITMFLVPVSLTWIVVGFVLFRVFDIWKPWPIGWVDKQVGGGLGIMLDDVVAGLAAWVFLQLLVWSFS